MSTSARSHLHVIDTETGEAVPAENDAAFNWFCRKIQEDIVDLGDAADSKQPTFWRLEIINATALNDLASVHKKLRKIIADVGGE